jgi:hypothetical protein
MSIPEPSDKPAATTAVARQSTAPLLLWLTIQLGAILLAVLRVPLAAVYVEPPERLAPQLMLTMQVVIVGMLFPFLLRDWRLALQVTATALPFQLAAAYLGGLAAREILSAMAFMATWTLTLTVWRASLRSRTAELAGACLATCLTLGGGILHYLRLEFAPGPAPAAAFETASPLLTTLAAVDGNPTRLGWILLVCLLLAALATASARRFRRRRVVATA